MDKIKCDWDNISNIKLQDNGLIPAIIQDARTNQVLMLGYMNKRSIEQTIDQQKVTFFSRSKQRLWTKGETSGNFLHFREGYIDCDSDTLLIKAIPEGPVCHRGTNTCFDQPEPSSLSFLSQLMEIIDTRRQQMPEGSYTTYLFEGGVDRIAQKVGEEAVEMVIAAKNQNNDEFLGEAADLLYHIMVLLKAKGLNMEEVCEVLRQRHEKSSGLSS